MQQTLEATTSDNRRADVAVVGGGLAGLAAAAILARAGRSVVLFEKAPKLGGRAATTREGQFRLNLGPHALYRRGPGAAVLDMLGIEPRGQAPPTAGALALRDGALHRLPVDLRSLLTTTLLRPFEKLEAARLLTTLARIEPSSLDHLSVAEWSRREIRHAGTRRLFEALIRTATYAADADRQSAGAALRQLQLAASGGVLYLDDGWQTLVDGLGDAARAAGARIVADARVTAVVHNDAVSGIRLADGTTWDAPAAILAVGPDRARDLVRDSGGPLDRWADAVTPVRLACLDVGLARLPRPRTRVLFGIDEPLYFSVHSAVARLAPPGGAVIHLAEYLRADAPSDPAAIERRLEGLLDRLQPGWRDAVLVQRFLPAMTVTNALPSAVRGGLAGRPGPAVPGIHGLYVAGDWVGPEGMLADAALASARRAAEALAASPLPRAEHEMLVPTVVAVGR